MAKTLKKRFPEIDLLRSIAILGMVLYHAAFDLEFFYDWDIALYSGWWLLLARTVATLFITLVGVSFVISIQNTPPGTIWKKSLRRAGIILGNAAAISLVTYIANPHTYIRFGILHMIGVSALLLPLFRNFKQWNLCIGMIVIFIGMTLKGTTLETSLLLPLGVTPVGFASLDYFPLLPWLGAMLVGMSIGYFFYEERIPSELSTYMKWFTFPGRHALLMYMIHQPILIAALWLIY